MFACILFFQFRERKRFASDDKNCNNFPMCNRMIWTTFSISMEFISVIQQNRPDERTFDFDVVFQIHTECILMKVIKFKFNVFMPFASLCCNICLMALLCSLRAQEGASIELDTCRPIASVCVCLCLCECVCHIL